MNVQIRKVSSTPALAALLECLPCVPVLGYGVPRPPGEGGAGVGLESPGDQFACAWELASCKTTERELGVINVEMWESGMCAHKSVEALRPFSHNCALCISSIWLVLRYILS